MNNPEAMNESKYVLIGGINLLEQLQIPYYWHRFYCLFHMFLFYLNLS